MIQYLGRYTHRVALANHRIITVEDDRVTFWYKDYGDKSKRKSMALHAFEFIRRFLLHILPDGFVKIRYFGFLANRMRKEKLELCHRLLAAIKDAPVRETWQEHLLRVTGMDVMVCSVCQGRMRTRDVIPPLRGPP